MIRSFNVIYGILNRSGKEVYVWNSHGSSMGTVASIPLGAVTIIEPTIHRVLTGV